MTYLLDVQAVATENARWQPGQKPWTQRWQRRAGLNSSMAKLPSRDGPAQRGPCRAHRHVAAPDPASGMGLSLPEERLTEFMRDLLGVTLCSGALTNMRRKAAHVREPRIELPRGEALE